MIRCIQVYQNPRSCYGDINEKHEGAIKKFYWWQTPQIVRRTDVIGIGGGRDASSVKMLSLHSTVVPLTLTSGINPFIQGISQDQPVARDGSHEPLARVYEPCCAKPLPHPHLRAPLSHHHQELGPSIQQLCCVRCIRRALDDSALCSSPGEGCGTAAYQRPVVWGPRHANPQWMERNDF